MNISTVKIFENNNPNNLLKGYFYLRKKVFLDLMGWELHQTREMEFEQYDTPNVTYLIAHDGEAVLGGARLTRTDTKQPSDFGAIPYTYMIKDAFDGRLPQLPPQICEAAPPTDAATWELTRLVSNGNQGVGRSILDATNDFLKNAGASACLFLGPPAFMKMARAQGYNPTPIGKIQGNQDGRFLAFRCEVKP
jgi:acyl homoserine lactone synthase